ncbi:MAG: LPS export ABC transporter periplasmic protein LptC [Paracoccaceae bacterium]
MADALALHSRVVFWLKILLPLAALLILSTLFLLARGPAPDGTIPFSDVDLKGLAGDPRVTAPEYSGMTADGASVTVTAAEARPGQGGDSPATATGIAVIYERPGGTRATITADRGALAPEEGSLDLSGSVVLRTSTGYVLTADRTVMDLDLTRLASDGPVTIDGPFGRIEAGSMLLDAASGRGGHDVLVFRGGVRVRYDPANPVSPANP